jgi:hypothetical protein
MSTGSSGIWKKLTSKMNTEMKKQTAVKWLYDYLLQLNETREWRSKDLHIEKFDELFIDALAMEKEQIIDAFNYARYRLGDSSDYYNETYGDDK